MIPIQRLGHATLETTDIEKSLDYYATVNGLVVVSRDANTVHLASRMGMLTVALVKSDRNECTGLSFEVAPDADFADIAKQLSAEGIPSQVRSSPFPGSPRALVFKDPKGTTIELFSKWDFLVDARVPIGAGILKIGHVAHFVQDMKRTVAFYQDVLGFRVSDWIGDIFVFMRCNTDHHTVNFFVGDSTRLNHMAFEVKDFAQIQQSCETLGLLKMPLTWGPLRHGPGHNIAAYHRNPEGHIVEHYCELDQMKNEALGYFDPRPWHTDRPQKPKVWTPTEGITAGWGVPSSPEHRRGRYADGPGLAPVKPEKVA